MTRVRQRGWSRSGLPTICGVKLPDGRECRAKAGPFGACEWHSDPAQRPKMPATLDPAWFAQWYLHWLEQQGREPVIAEDTQGFLQWWAAHPIIDKVQVPFQMDLHRLKAWWLIWCRVTGQERVIPFDISRFCEYWLVT